MAVLPLDTLPLGFRFHPTDEELVNHYLKRKITGGRINSDAVAVIPEVDVCKCEPWDLPDKSVIRSDDPEWFFFTPRDRKFVNGPRHNRATVAGYWKATGKDRLIKARGGGGTPAVIGMKKTLVFHRGRAPRGVRTCWIMHEYRTTEPEFDSGEQGHFVLCRLFKKLEENNPSITAVEAERSGLSPAPTRSSPSDTHHGADDLDECATPEQELPETNLHGSSRILPTTVDNQPAHSQTWLVDGADNLTTYPLKPEEDHYKSNMASAVANHEADIGAEDDIAELLKSFDAEPDPMGELLYTEFGNQEVDLAELLNIQKDPFDGLVPPFQVYPGNVDSPLEKVSRKERGTSSKVDNGSVLPVAQGGSVPYGSGLSNEPPSLSNACLQLNTSENYKARLSQIEMFCMSSPVEGIGQSLSSVDEPISTSSFIGNKPSTERCYNTEKSSSQNDFTGNVPWENFVNCTEESTIPLSFAAGGIEVRNRQPNLSPDDTNNQQGSAIRRMRLQDCKREVYTIDTGSSTNKADCDISTATEVVEYSEDQFPKREDPGHVEHQCFFDTDNTTVTEIEPPEASQEHNFSVRLRRRLNNDTGTELKGKSLHPDRPRPGTVAAIRVAVVLLVTFLMVSVGIWSYLRTCKLNKHSGS